MRFFGLFDKSVPCGFFRLFENPNPFEHEIGRELEVDETGPSNGGFPLFGGGKLVDQALSHFAGVLPVFLARKHAVRKISNLSSACLRLESIFETLNGFCRFDSKASSFSEQSI